jgi:hypothetical protein
MKKERKGYVVHGKKYLKRTEIHHLAYRMILHVKKES